MARQEYGARLQLVALSVVSHGWGLFNRIPVTSSLARNMGAKKRFLC